jgi:hypothetical protein
VDTVRNRGKGNLRRQRGFGEYERKRDRLRQMKDIERQVEEYCRKHSSAA